MTSDIYFYVLFDKYTPLLTSNVILTEFMPDTY